MYIYIHIHAYLWIYACACACIHAIVCARVNIKQRLILRIFMRRYQLNVSLQNTSSSNLMPHIV